MANPAMVALLVQIIFLAMALGVLALMLTLGGYLMVVWYRHRDREDRSLETVCLQVAVPRDN